MDIHTALTLIEQYVESLQAWELKDEYDKAASSMFAWLRDYGCSHSDLGLACSIIQEATGYHPSHIRTLDDASVVKEAIYSAMNSECLGKRLRPTHKAKRVRWAIANVRFGFSRGRENDPIDDCADNSNG